MRWERGRADIERLIADGELERVPPSDEVAARLLSDAEAHIALASKGIEDDPAGALQLSYGAARKASASLLALQGLRSTTRGGHITVIDAVRAQFNDRGGMEVFARPHALRRRRNRTEYPDLDSHGVNEDDASQALDTAAPPSAQRNVSSTAGAWIRSSRPLDDLEAIDHRSSLRRAGSRAGRPSLHVISANSSDGRPSSSPTCSPTSETGDNYQ